MQKDLGVCLSADPKSAKHVDEIVLKANRILGMISRNIEHKAKGIIFGVLCAGVEPSLCQGRIQIGKGAEKGSQNDHRS